MSSNAANDATNDEANNSTSSQADATPKANQRLLIVADVFLGVVLCYLLVGGPVPDVNEAHYLAKARHYWQPEWGNDDIFLESDDTHLAFYWSVGWITAWLPLVAAAWVLRLSIWLFLSWSMSRLVQTLSPGAFRGGWAVGLFTWLMMNFHLAGEWVVGGAEAKGVAYGLVFLGIEAMCRNRWNRTWFLFGGAAAFHVLVGGWSVVAAAVAWLCVGRSRPSLQSMWRGLLAGGAFSLLGLLPALATSAAEPGIAAEANWIYVYKRLPHHLVIHRFSPTHWLRFSALAVVSFVGVLPLARTDLRARRLAAFACGAAVIALVGLLIDQALLTNLDRAAGILRFYWYRLADVAIPLLATLVVLMWQRRLARARPNCGAVLLLVSVWGPILWWSSHRESVAFRAIPGADRQTLLHGQTDEDFAVSQYLAWRQCCQWVNENTPSSAMFLTPRTQQTFKFYAQRAEVANWKDVPQDASSIVEWHRRMGQLYPPSVSRNGLIRHSDRRLASLARRYDVDYLVVRRKSYSRTLDPQRFRRVYPAVAHENPYFQVYEVIIPAG
jgi:hypothetical protein